MRIGFKFFTSDSIEKSKKGVRRSNHKYIRVFTGNNGKDEYIYPEDMKNPFKKLLSIFAITKEKIASVFKNEKIEENYGVDENTFAAHVLEYLTDRVKWDKFFSEPVNSHVNKKPVNLNKKKDQTGRKVEEKKPEENKDGKIKINRSLMRKVWAIFNPAKEFETELSFNAKAGPVAATTEVVNVAEEKAKDDIRDWRKESDWEELAIETGKAAVCYLKGKKYTDIQYVQEFSKEKIERYLDFMRDSLKELESTNEAGWSESTIEGLRLAIKDLENLLVVKNENEDHENRSKAMMGNDNAKKDFIEEETEKDAEKTAADKAEFNMLTSRLVELDKEFKANGGYSYKRTTREQDEKRRAARKETNEIESKLRDFKIRIEEENKGNDKIPEVYKEGVTDWIKRKVKRQTISTSWLEKKFGGYNSWSIPFGDGFAFDLSNTETIENPVVRIYYEQYGVTHSVTFEVGEMNKEGYWPRYMNYNNIRDTETFNEVANKFRGLKEKINSYNGNTTEEKFYNLVLGEDNEYNKSSGISDVPRYRFTKDGIKGRDGNLEKIRADLRNEGTPEEGIWLMADSYGHSIPSIFYPENDTDSQTDYFDKDSCFVKPDHPYYNHLKVMALKRDLYQGRATKWNKMNEADQKELEKKIKDLEKTLTEPTDEELAAYRVRRDHEEEVKEKWKEGERAALRKEQEKREKEKEKENTRKFFEMLDKFAEMIVKEPPVNLNGLTKDEKITALEDRIFKLGMEIKNLTDPETIESKTRYREKLTEALAKVREEPETIVEEETTVIEPEKPIRNSTEVANELADVKRKMFTAEDEEMDGLKTRLAELNEELKEATAREISAEEHQNRSQAMLGNQNAYKGGPKEVAKYINGKTTDIKERNKMLSAAFGERYGTDPTYKFAQNAIGQLLIKVRNETPHSDGWYKAVNDYNDAAEMYKMVIGDNGIAFYNQEMEKETMKPNYNQETIPEPEKTPSEQLRETVDNTKQELENLESQRGQGNGFELDKKIEATRQKVHEEEMAEKDQEDGITTPIPTIDPNVARRVSDISMSGTAGDVYQHDVNIEMKEFREKFDTSKMNEQQKEYFQERLNSYAALVGSSYNEMASKRLAAGPSWAVAGPARYNNKRFAQKMESERRAYENFTEKKDKFIKNTEKELKRLKYQGGAENEEDVKNRVFEDYANGNYSWNDKVDNTDPYAIEKISGKIKYMENAHDVTLMYGKNCKKAGLTTSTWTDRTEEDTQKRKAVMLETIKAAKEKGYSDRQIKQGMEHPFPQNQNQEIARNKKRLEELKARKAAIEVMANRTEENGNGASVTPGRVDFDGGYVYENLDMDRIQIIYDGKPDKDTISKLKHNGFHWTPSQGAWQRQLNRNGRSAVNRVFEETGVDTKIDIGGAGEVKKADQKEDQMFIKAFEYCDFYLGRSYNVGDLRTWKGKVFRLNKSGTWERFI